MFAGSAHIHGVLFLDLDTIVDNEVKKGRKVWKFLQSGMRRCRDSQIPSEDEETAIRLFVDKFISCSLFHPRSRKIAREVQHHNHTFSCRKAGSKCRFKYPRYPALRTILAKPLRIVFKEEDDNKRKSIVMKMRLALSNVRSVLEDKEEMEKLEEIHSDELEEIVRQRDIVQRFENILEDDIFREQILRLNQDYKGEVKDKLGNLLIDNLQLLYEEQKDTLKKLEAKEPDYFRARLLEVLKKADLYKIFEIDQNLDEDERNIELLKEYHELLSYSTKGYSVVLKRDISEIFINNFNEEWLPAWNSNMDISPVFDFYSVLVYVSDYFLKSDEKILQKLVDAVKQTGDMNLRKKLTTMRDCFLTHRSMGECEMFYRLIPSMHLADSNLGTVFVHTGLNKSKFLRKAEDGDAIENSVSIENRDGLYFETSSISDKYLKRPASMKNLSLIQFAKRYTPINRTKQEEELQSDEENEELETKLEAFEDNFENSIHQDFIIARDASKRKKLETIIALEGSFYTGEPRFMKLRKKPLVIRIHKFKMDTETHDFCYSQLELYYIFKDEVERKRCEEDVQFCYQTYMDNQEDINYMKRKAMPYMNYVEDAMETAQEIVNNDIGDVLDPENEKDNEDAQVEGFQEPDSFVAFDYDKEPQDSLPNEQLFKRIEVKEFEILSQKTRELDDDQLYVVTEIINYAKSYQRCRVTNEAVPDPLMLKILGTAGTGKSHVINIVAQWMEHYLRQSGDGIDSPYVIKCSFTGSASSQIDGQTLHKAFSLSFGDKKDEGKYKSLADKTRDKLTTALKNLRLGKNFIYFQTVFSTFLYFQ